MSAAPSIRYIVFKVISGPDVVLLKDGTRICGSGGALATVPIIQNKAFFEVVIQQFGIWGVGLTSREGNLSIMPEVNTWILRNDGSLLANGEIIDKANREIVEGDLIGVSFDHLDLKFHLSDGDGNQVQLILPMSNVRGIQLYPFLFVDDNAILDVKFRSFLTKPPPGFEQIMVEQTLL